MTLFHPNTIVMLDACYPRVIAKAKMVAGYLDGPCKWPAGAWTRFPKARKVKISIYANYLADVFDYEKGTYSLDQVRAVVRYRATAYYSSVLYCSENNLEVARGAMSGLPVAFWVADWTGKLPTLPDIAAKKWVAQQAISTTRYDESLVNLNAWPNTCYRI